MEPMSRGVGIIYVDQYFGPKPLCTLYIPTLQPYILEFWVCRVERFGVLGSGSSLSLRVYGPVLGGIRLSECRGFRTEMSHRRFGKMSD